MREVNCYNERVCVCVCVMIKASKAKKLRCAERDMWTEGMGKKE